MTLMISGRMKLAEFARSVHVATMPAGVDYEKALDPAFWAHVAQQIKSRDRIELWAEDGSWFADLIVVKAGRLETHVKELVKIDFDTPATIAPPASAPSTGYHVDYGGAVDLYRVIRDADSMVMTQGLSQTAAQQWITEHIAAQATVSVKPTSLSPAPETNETRAAVVIPENWKDLSWQERRSIASRLTDDAVRNGEEANAAIEAELTRRAA